MKSRDSLAAVMAITHARLDHLVFGGGGGGGCGSIRDLLWGVS